jgi:hypothetical protein
MQSIGGISGGSAWAGSNDSVLRAAQVLVSRLGNDVELIQDVVNAGRQAFTRRARAELRGFGLSSADLDRVLQLVRDHLKSSRP